MYHRRQEGLGGQCGDAVSAEGYDQHGVVCHGGGEEEKIAPADQGIKCQTRSS